MQARYVVGVIAGTLLLAGSALTAHEEHAGGAQTLTGEVVDVMCYLSHGASGLGAGHADCGKKCVLGGLPVAIKVGDQLYLAVGSKHETANATLAPFVGQMVTVMGEVLERDGQHLIAISQITPQ